MKYKFLIYFSYSYAIPTGTPLQNVIQSRGDEVWWFCDESEGRRSLPNGYKVFESIQEVVDYEPDIVLTITDLVPDFIPGLKVQNFHGFDPEKRNFDRGHCRIRGLFDLYCTQGPSTTSVFRMHQEKQPHFEAIETGWPKVDPLFPVLEKQPGSRPTIFMASTFSKKLSLAYNDAVFEEVQRIVAGGAYKFLLVLHPILPQEIKDKWKALECESFEYHDTTDLIPLMRDADVMFSDTTSAIQEFGLQEKPIVTFKHFVPKPYLINVESPSEIQTAFELALSKPAEVLEKLAHFNEQLHPYRDGKSSERVIEACIDFLHKDKRHLIKKPLNLVRKYKLRKHLGVYPLRSYRKPWTVEMDA